MLPTMPPGKTRGNFVRGVLCSRTLPRPRSLATADVGVVLNLQVGPREAREGDAEAQVCR